MIWLLESIKDHFDWDWKEFIIVSIAACLIAVLLGTVILLELVWRIQIWKWLLS